MNESRTERALSNGVVSVLSRLLLTVAPFTIRSIMIYTLGVNYLGLNSLFSSILSVLSLSELGFSNAVIFSMYKPMAEGDDQKVCALLNFYRKVYNVVGTVIVVGGVTCLPFLDKLISSDYPKEVNIYVIYVIYLANASLTYFVFAYKNSIFIASMRNDIDNAVTTICQVAMYLTQILIMLVYPNYYVYAICMPLFTLINNVVKSELVRKRYPQYTCNGSLEKAETKDIATRVGALIGNKIGGVVFSSVDSIVISAFLGLTILGQYSNYYLILTSVSGLVSITFTSIQAVIGNSITCKDENQNYGVFNELLLINSWITVFSTCCFACLYQNFIEIWVGKENVLGEEIAICLAIFYFCRGIRKVCYTYKEAAGMWREDFLKPYVSVVINLVANIILVQVIGLPGVIISSIIALAFVEIPWETQVFFKLYFKKNTKEYYLKVLKVILVTILSTVLAFVICKFFPNTIWGLVVRIGICFIVSNVIFVAGFLRTKEFQSVKQRVVRLLKKG